MQQTTISTLITVPAKKKKKDFNADKNNQVASSKRLEDGKFASMFVHCDKPNRIKLEIWGTAFLGSNKQKLIIAAL